MKQLGYLLLIGGFLAGAYATALDVQHTDWTLFAPAALVAAAGLVQIKRGARGEARAEHVLTANRAELESSLDRIVVELDDLKERMDETPVGALRHEIDARFRVHLRRFADARESMVHLFGVQAYADIMSEFAAGERNLNRVWSASTDGYAGEASAYLVHAGRRFRNARQQLQAAITAV
jgi:hypothetical protein